MSWGLGNSTVVFERAVKGCDVRLGTRVRQLQLKQDNSGGGTLYDDQGGVEIYDRIVFACPATAVSAMLRGSSWVENALIGGVYYQDDFSRDDW